MSNGIAFFKSHHSLHEASGHTAKYIAAAVERGIDKLAMIDHASMADMISFYDKANQAGITPYMGQTLRIADTEHLSFTLRNKNSDFFEKLDAVIAKMHDSESKSSDFDTDREFEKTTFCEDTLKAEKFTANIVKADKEKTALKKAEKRFEAFINYLSDCGFNDTIVGTLKKCKKSGDPWNVAASTRKKLTDDELESLEHFCSSFSSIELSELFDLAKAFVAKTEKDYSDLVVIAPTGNSFERLKEIVSWAYVEGQSPDLIEIKNKKRKVDSFPKTLTSRLSKKTEELFCIVGLREDFLGKAVLANDPTAIEWAVNFFTKLFGNRIIVAVERSASDVDGLLNINEQELFNEQLLDVVEQYKLPAIAYNKALYVNESDYVTHDVKESILLEKKYSDVTREKKFLHGHKLSDWAQMTEDFADLPVLISNAEKLGEHFKKTIGSAYVDVHIDLDKPVLPEFPIPEGYTPTSFMREVATNGVTYHLENKFKKKFKIASLSDMSAEQKCEYDNTWNIYKDRIDYEVGIIDDMGFPGYFLIVSDFIVWAKENGVPVGPGRGSGAGSIVAYGLKITDVDPIEHGLLFERFLNPERVSMPDFDVDFGAGFHPVTGEFNTRDSVIAYVANKYNKPDEEFPSVAQIATHGLMAPKSAAKAIAKVKHISLRYAEDLTSEFPEKPDLKMHEVLSEPAVIERLAAEPLTKELIELSAEATGLKKSSGVHAGGVVIAPAALTRFTPVMSDIRDMRKLIAQLDKNDVERGGLVKFDFLGLANLTTMSYALKHIENVHGVKIKFEEIHMDDPETYKLLQDANSHGVFQVESRGMKDLLRRVQVENIEELSALLALFRPGPIQSGMVDNFVARKHGLEKVSYPDEKYQHELLKPILEPTYGIILYQEQVMQIAQALAGYTLGGADMLRRAMGKKKPEEMAKQRSIFEEGAIKNGVDGELAMRIFDLVEKFAGYGFNKSHSMAYAYISYYTAWLKAHYPTEYMSAVLSSQMDDMDNLKFTLEDCKKNGIEILQPDINLSDAHFKPEGHKKIRFGLGAIHGVGEKKLTKILEEREKNGSFSNVFEMKKRCRSMFDTAVSENLAFAGALDSLETIFPIPDGSLRTREVPEPVATAIQFQNELEQRLEDMAEIESRFDIVTGFGKELRRMIESLVAHYNRKYEVGIDSELDLESQLRELWKFFGTKLSQPQELTQESLHHITSDFDVLRAEFAKRSSSAGAYKKYKVELEKKKSEVELVKNKIAKAIEDDKLAKAEWEKTKHEKSVLVFDKRAFHLAEAAMVSSLKATDLGKPLEEMTYISAKDYYAEINQSIANYISSKTLNLIDGIEEGGNALGTVIEAETDRFVKIVTDCGFARLTPDEEFKLEVKELALKTFKTDSAIGDKDIEKYTELCCKIILSNHVCTTRIIGSCVAKKTRVLSDKDRLKAEMQRLSYYVTGHPLDVDNLRAKLKARGKYCDIGFLMPAEIDPVTEKPVDQTEYRTAGIITDIRKLKVKKDGKLFGREMAAFKLDDGTGVVKVTAFPDTYDVIKDYLFMGEPICVTGTVALDDFANDGTLVIDISVIEDVNNGKPIFETPRQRYKPRKEREAHEVAERDGQVKYDIAKALNIEK